MPRADAERRHAAGIVTLTLGDRPITAREIASLVDGAETVYGVLLCLRWLERDAFRPSPGHRDDFYFFARDIEEQFTLGSRIDWKSFSHHFEWKKRFAADQVWLFSQLDKLYERGPSEYEDPKQRIFLLRAVQYRSPGFITFEGLGEIVRQVREFIKDFWWRNEHERKQAKLKRRESEQLIEMKDLELTYAKEYLAGNKVYRTLHPTDAENVLDAPTALLTGALKDLNVAVPDPDGLDKDPLEDS